MRAPGALCDVVSLIAQSGLGRGAGDPAKKRLRARSSSRPARSSARRRPSRREARRDPLALRRDHARAARRGGAHRRAKRQARGRDGDRARVRRPRRALPDDGAPGRRGVLRRGPRGASDVLSLRRVRRGARRAAGITSARGSFSWRPRAGWTSCASFARRCRATRGSPFRCPAGGRKSPPELAELLSQCDGRRSVAEIGRRIGQLEFEVTRGVFQLVAAGLVSVTPPRPEGVAAIVETYNRAIVEIHLACDEAGSGQELRAGLEQFAMSTGVYVPLFSGAGPAEDGALRAERIAQNAAAIGGDAGDRVADAAAPGVRGLRALPRRVPPAARGRGGPQGPRRRRPARPAAARRGGGAPFDRPRLRLKVEGSGRTTERAGPARCTRPRGGGVQLSRRIDAPILPDGAPIRPEGRASPRGTTRHPRGYARPTGGKGAHLRWGERVIRAGMRAPPAGRARISGRVSGSSRAGFAPHRLEGCASPVG